MDEYDGFEVKPFTQNSDLLPAPHPVILFLHQASLSLLTLFCSAESLPLTMMCMRADQGTLP